MNLYDAAMRALAQGRAIRRPSMPAGYMLVPVGMDPMRSFLVDAEGRGLTGWRATVEDLVATDWSIADWRSAPVSRLACG